MRPKASRFPGFEYMLIDILLDNLDGESVRFKASAYTG
jgi:hypothetical protein